MASWMDVAPVVAFDEGGWHTVTLPDDTAVVVYCLDGEFFALEDRCTHDDNALAGLPLDGEEIICPRHGARFCVRTGAVTAPPAYEDLPTYPCRVHEGHVQVAVD